MDATLVSTATSRAFAARLAQALCLPLAEVERQDFPDGETYLRLPMGDRFGLLGRAVVVAGAAESRASIDEMASLACAAVKYGAEMLVLAVPYLAYSTMERAVKPGEVVAAKVVARQFSAIPRAPRGNWVLLMDLHAPGIVHYFEGDAVALELSAEPAILDAIRGLGLDSPVLASTDMGRAKAVERLANALHAPVALIHKKRLSGSETKVAAVVGEVAGRDVVVYDDMIRSGGSLVQAARAYRAAGARSVHAATTHLVIPGGAVEALEAAPLATVIGTDTHPASAGVLGRERFRVLPTAPLFAAMLRRLLG
ncbi:MAG: ribose-phosphate diphosphokinase [Gemmataceae bacterium]|nr:ribose-phosphate diphosphokinase [Gemmataceae bacterium]